MAVTWTQLLVFLPAAALVGCSPGANNILAMRNGLKHGTHAAVVALTGRLAAFAAMLALASAGLASLLVNSHAAFTTVKWLGIAYLAYLGVRSLLGHDTVAPETNEPVRVSRRSLARQEFTTVAANPKALLLLTAFLPQFIDASRPATPQLLALGTTYIVLELSGAAAWAHAGKRLRPLTTNARARRLADRIVGASFLGLAGLLARSKP